MSARKCAVFGIICCISYALLNYSGGWGERINVLLGGNIAFLIPPFRAVLAFLLPGMMLSRLSKGKNSKRTAPPSPSDLFTFSLSVSLFFASLGFFLAYFYSFNYILPYFSAVGPINSEPYFLWLIFGLGVPVIMEEYFLRKVLYHSLTRFGTTLAILSSSILYAMLQGSGTAFWGALISGVVFCLISEFISSSVPSSAVRIACIIYHQLFTGLVGTYEVYGLEYVFLLLNLIILLISCYFLLLFTERFIKRGRRPIYRKIPAPATRSIAVFILNPGMLAFFVLYIMVVCNVI